MSNRDVSTDGLETFLKKFSVPILALISLISTISGFVKLFTDKDAGLITLVALIVGILLLFIICLYYARFWKPEQQDKGLSAFAPPTSNEQEKAQAKKEHQRKWVRRSAVAGLVLIPLLSLSGVVGYYYVQNRPTNDIIILVADFEGPDAQNYFVTKTIYKNLETATEPYRDVKVKRLNKIIQERKEARENGDSQKASIVIWGSYGKTRDTVPISTNFELLKKPDDLPEFGPEARGKVRTAALTELESIKLQTRLSQEMAYLTLLTLGISRYQAEDWNGAIARLSNALTQVAEHVSAPGQSSVYFFRGSAYYHKDDYDHAIADYNRAIQLNPNESSAYNNLGIIYSLKGNYDKGIANSNQAIKLRPNDAKIYRVRGTAYLKKSDYNNAIADFNRAIKLDPNNAENYFMRAGIYYAKHDLKQVIADLNQAIKLQPDNALYYQQRGINYNLNHNYDLAIADFSQAIKLQPNDAVNYIRRGDAYYYEDNYDSLLLITVRQLDFNLKTLITMFTVL